MSERLSGEIRVIKKNGICIPGALSQYDVLMKHSGQLGGNFLHWVYAIKKDSCLELKIDSSGPHGSSIIPYKSKSFDETGVGDVDAIVYKNAIEMGRKEAEKRGLRFFC